MLEPSQARVPMDGSNCARTDSLSPVCKLKPTSPTWRCLTIAALSLSATWCRAEFEAEKYLVYSLGNLSLRPQLEVTETFDSNLFYSEEDPVSDFITSFRPGVRAVYGDEDDTFFSLRYTLDGSFYAERSDLNNLGHAIGHISRIRLPRLTIQGEDQFSITRNILGGTFSYIQRRVGQMSLSDSWRADYALSPRTSIGVRGQFEFVDYDEEDLQGYLLYDYASYSGSVRVGYLPSEKVVLFPEITVGQSFLEPNLGGPTAPDLTFYGFSFGAEGDFTPKLTGLVTGGYELREFSDDSDVPDGWVASVQLRWQPREKTTVVVGYRHWIQVSRERFRSTYTAHRPTIGIHQDLGTQDRWSVDLNATYQFDDYSNPIAVGGGESILRRDDRWSFSLRANYRWKSWLVASAGYDFLKFEDNFPNIPTYDVHRLMLRLAAGY